MFGRTLQYHMYRHLDMCMHMCTSHQNTPQGHRMESDRPYIQTPLLINKELTKSENNKIIVYLLVFIEVSLQLLYCVQCTSLLIIIISNSAESNCM